MDTKNPQELTADGRYLIIKGRKWRASNPSIPAALRHELVDELMAARRGVRNKEAHARVRVHDAKVALGERGHPWWEDSDPEGLNERITATVRTLLRRRFDTSICAEEVARIVTGPNDEWRNQMPAVRAVVARMAAADIVVVTQLGEQVSAEEARGPIRVAQGSEFDVDL